MRDEHKDTLGDRRSHPLPNVLPICGQTTCEKFHASALSASPDCVHGVHIFSLLPSDFGFVLTESVSSATAAQTTYV